MHTVELLKEAVEAAGQLGYEVRLDWLGGEGGGHCVVRGRKWLLLDLAKSPDEQLEDVADALREEPDTAGLTLSADLTRRLAGRRVA